MSNRARFYMAGSGTVRLVRFMPRSAGPFPSQTSDYRGDLVGVNGTGVFSPLRGRKASSPRFIVPRPWKCSRHKGSVWSPKLWPSSFVDGFFKRAARRGTSGWVVGWQSAHRMSHTMNVQVSIFVFLPSGRFQLLPITVSLLDTVGIS